MGADIDQLNIKIEADAQKAHSSVDTLINKLGRLNAALGGINTSNLASLSNGIQRLSSSMQSMKNIGTADFTRLSKNIQKMGQLDSRQLGKAAGSIHRFVNALGTIDKINVSDNSVQIGQLAKGISQLGYKSSTQAIENIPKLATSMRQLMSELSKAPKVSQNLIQMTDALARLARTGSSSGRAANSLGNSLDLYTASTHRARKGTSGLAAAFGKMYATYWLAFRVFRKIGDAINISSDLTEVQNVVDVTFGNMSSKVEEFAKTSIEQFGMSELSLKKYASRFQAMGTAMGINSSSIGSASSFLNKQTNGYVGLSKSMSDVSLNLTKLTADMASFYNVEQKDVAEDLESVFTGMTRPLRQYGLDLTEATLKEWALKNGLDADIKSMSQAEKTMLRYQYVMANTGAAQGDFARTANTWANQIRILKQNFEKLASVIGGAFIQALKPLVSALNTAMSHIIAFAETISNALGKIFGWKYEGGSGGLTSDFGDAADSADDIAGSTGKAAKNIDKMKNSLRAFDELKTISSKDNQSGSGSGSGVAGTSGGSGGRWTKQDSIFDDYKSSIDSLYGLGEYIRKTLVKEVGGIKWETVYEKASHFGTGLAEFLNGLFSSDKKGNNVFTATADVIAGALNSVLFASKGFTDKFEFKTFGSNIASGINRFFDKFNFDLLAESLNGWVDGLEGTIAGFLKTVKWSAILDKAGQFLGDLELDTIAVIIGAIMLKNNAGKLLGASWLTSQIAAKFGISAGTISLYVGLSITVGAITLSVLNHARGWVDSLKKWWKETSVGSSHVGYDENGNQIEVHLSMKATIDRMRNTMSAKAKKDWSDFIGKVTDKKIEIEVAIKTKAMELWDDFHTSWNNVKNKIAYFKTKIETKADSLWGGFKKEWGDFRTADFLLKIKSKALELWSEFKKKWGDTKTASFSLKIGTKASELWNSFKTGWGTSKKVSIGIGFGNNALSNLWNSVTSFFSGKSVKIGAGSTQKADGGVFSNGSWKPIQKYAVGGIPNYGQMFIAREAGPELVGTLGGHTAVMNNDQIVASVSSGVYQAVTAAISNNKSGNGNIHLTINLDGKVVYDNVRERAAEHFFRTGEPAFPI